MSTEISATCEKLRFPNASILQAGHNVTFGWRAAVETKNICEL